MSCDYICNFRVFKTIAHTNQTIFYSYSHILGRFGWIGDKLWSCITPESHPESKRRSVGCGLQCGFKLHRIEQIDVPYFRCSGRFYDFSYDWLGHFVCVASAAGQATITTLLSQHRKEWNWNEISWWVSVCLIYTFELFEMQIDYTRCDTVVHPFTSAFLTFLKHRYNGRGMPHSH